MSADLLIDVGGYYATAATGRYMPVDPARLMDSRQGLGTPARLAAGQVVELPVVGIAGIPTNATAVALNVTGVVPSTDSYITVFPCGGLPSTSSLNPAAGKVTPNMVMAQVSANGTVCFYASTDIDLVVDVVGYASAAATNKFTPSAPFRFTDTRDGYRTEVNAGQNGARLARRPDPGRANRRSAWSARQRQGDLRQPDSGRRARTPATSPPSRAANCPAPRASTTRPLQRSPTQRNCRWRRNGAICIYSTASAQVIIDVNGWWS